MTSENSIAAGLALDPIRAAAYPAVEPFPPSPNRNPSFVSGDRESMLLRVKYYRNAETRHFLGRAWFGPRAEGPPGHAHGGSQAAVLDEAMGALGWLDGHTVLAAKIEVNFRRSLPIGSFVTIEAKVTGSEGKKIFISGTLTGDDGTVYADSTGLFVKVVIIPDGQRRANA